MKNKNANLAVVSKRSERKRTPLPHELESQGYKLTRTELAKRVHDLRLELEAAKERYDGARFDNYHDDIPPSLDIVDVNQEPSGAVWYLSPLLKAMLDYLQHGRTGDISDEVGNLYFCSTASAFEVGMLAGAIYADLPTVIIDRWERGLVTALAARHWIIKR